MNTLTKKNNGTARGRLLATASSIAIIVSAGAWSPAFADGSKPVILLELGTDIQTVSASVKKADLPLGAAVSPLDLTVPFAEDFRFGDAVTGDGKITFRPKGSDWEFSASARYGRSGGKKSHINQALAPIPTTSFASYEFTYPLYPSSNKIRYRSAPEGVAKLNEKSISAEDHLVVDFDVGKDVGLGLFGGGGASVLSAGVRIANFQVSRTSDVHETNGIHFTSSHFITTFWPGNGTFRREVWGLLSETGTATESFQGIGPSIKWDASARLWSGPSGKDISLDWGANAALLFGKQKMKIQHQSSINGQCAGPNCPAPGAPSTSSDTIRTSRNITVPNVGGFMGITFGYADVKASFGYRADWFGDVTDAGLAGRKSSNMLLHGPYASISIGIDD